MNKRFILSSLLIMIAKMVFAASVIYLPMLYAEEKKEVKIVQLPDFSSVAEKVIPAVVSVRIQYSSKASLDDSEQIDMLGDEFWQRFFGYKRSERAAPQIVGQGSGVIISPDGYILTNNHIVKDADKLLVTTNDGLEFTGKVIGQDENTDLAVIKVPAENLPFIKLGNSDDIKVGQWVLAIGNPLGLQATMTSGIVSAKDRSNLGLAQFEDFIQTDASINKGNSGGALVNLDGELIGVPTAIATSTGGYMGIGFAIPSNMAGQILDQLIHDGAVTRGFLGIAMQKIDRNLAKALDLENASGALVAEVTRDSAADKAGILPGDILLRYNGTAIDNISHFRNAVSFMKPGQQITLDILRNKSPMTLKLEVGKHPDSLTAAAAGSINKLGLQVESLTTEAAQKYGYESDKGVLVSKVSPNSFGELAGIKKGSLILEINKQKITTPEQFNNAIAGVESGRPMLIYLKQGSSYRFISIQTE